MSCRSLWKKALHTKLLRQNRESGVEWLLRSKEKEGGREKEGDREREVKGERKREREEEEMREGGREGGMGRMRGREGENISGYNEGTCPSCVSFTASVS